SGRLEVDRCVEGAAARAGRERLANPGERDGVVVDDSQGAGDAVGDELVVAGRERADQCSDGALPVLLAGVDEAAFVEAVDGGSAWCLHGDGDGFRVGAGCGRLDMDRRVEGAATGAGCERLANPGE